MDESRLVRLQEVAVGRSGSAETALAQVEHHIPFVTHLQIRIEAQKAREVHQEGKVKVGIAARCHIKPQHGTTNIGKEGHILLLRAQGMIEKFSNKKCQS